MCEAGLLGGREGILEKRAGLRGPGRDVGWESGREGASGSCRLDEQVLLIFMKVVMDAGKRTKWRGQMWQVSDELVAGSGGRPARCACGGSTLARGVLPEGERWLRE